MRTFVLAIWITAVSTSVVWTWHYKTTPGLPSAPPQGWPTSVNVRHSGTTLVVALHPLCTCSEATISELARLMASVRDQPTVYALFYDYHPRTPLDESSLWRRASAIPGVIAMRDPDGEMAKSFGAETSGDVIAYSADGALLFHGGLTAARGHEGDSFGRQRLLAVLRGDAPDRRESPVFGCNMDELAKGST